MLNSILKINIKEIYIDNNEILPETDGSKLGILDIKTVINKREKINIKVQLSNEYNIVKRTLFYWSKLYTSDFKAGENYKDLNRTITINILGYNLDNNDEELHSQIMLTNVKTGEVITNMLEIHFIETPKILS